MFPTETPESSSKRTKQLGELNLINLPSSLKEASLAQVDLDDVGRYKALNC